MSAQPILTDADLEAMLRRRAGSEAPVGLVDEITQALAGLPDGRRPWWPLLSPPDRSASTLQLAWVLAIVALLLVALLAAGVFVAGWRSNQAVVLVPPPSPTATVDPAVATILATTKAKPLPPQATCAAGTDRDAPGPVNQERQASGGPGGMAFDRHAGRIVLLAADDDRFAAAGASQTWTYDVCTNTWQRVNPPEEPRGGWGSPGPVRLVYDADSDRTLALADPDIWSYELAADRWTRVGNLPVAADGATNILYGSTFYHDPSGLVVHYDGVSMWAYDVDTNTFSEVPQRPDPSLPAGSGLPAGKIAFGYDPRHDLVVAVVVPHQGSRGGNPPEYSRPTDALGETWTFDPGTGAWHREAAPAASDLIVCGFWYNSRDCYQTYGRSVFDEASGLTVFLQRDLSSPSSHDRVDAWDADLRAWRTLAPSTRLGGDGAYWCHSTPPVYDPLNGRILCESIPADHADGVAAFSTATGQWRWLLEPTPAATPSP